jgi:hypothetical protein
MQRSAVTWRGADKISQSASRSLAADVASGAAGGFIGASARHKYVCVCANTIYRTQ